MNGRIQIPRTAEVFLAEFRAWKRFRLRYVGWTSLVSLVGMFGGFLFFRLLDTKNPQSFEAALSIIFAGCLVVEIISLTFTYCRAGRFTPTRPWDVLGFFKILLYDCGIWRYKPIVSAAAEQERIEVEFSSDGCILFLNGTPSSTIPWRSATILWQFSDCWILVFDLQMFMPLPAWVLDESSREYLVRMIKQHGGKVKVNPGIGMGLIFMRKVF